MTKGDERAREGEERTGEGGERTRAGRRQGETETGRRREGKRGM